MDYQLDSFLFSYVTELLMYQADYSRVKSYCAISLLNCTVRKVVEKVVTTMLSDHCEWRETFHPGQYGCRWRSYDNRPIRLE
jgi:hypothetical protein